MLEDSQAAVVLSEESLREKIGGSSALVVSLDKVEEELARQSSDEPRQRIVSAQQQPAGGLCHLHIGFNGQAERCSADPWQCHVAGGVDEACVQRRRAERSAGVYFDEL